MIPNNTHSFRPGLGRRHFRTVSQWGRTLLASVALLLVCDLQSGCGKRPGSAGSGGPTLRISQRNEPATLDPHLATLPDEFFIIRALSEGLLVPSPDGGPPLPAAAESWRVSPDGLVYTFQIRPEARWSNGDPVTARDFAYSIERVLSPTLAAPKASLFFALKNAREFYAGREKDFSSVGVRALDDHRLELTLHEATADFLAIVASGPWIPVNQKVIEKEGGRDDRNNRWTRPGQFVGNGPFVLNDWRPNQQITVTRSSSYRNAGRVLLQEIDFVAFDNSDSEERAFRARQIDVSISVPFTKIPSYREAEPSPLHQVQLHETRYLALNTTKAPLNDPRVRKALALALDRRAITDKILRGGQRPAYSFIPPGLGGYLPQDQIGENGAAARELMAAAGFPDGKGFPRLELTSWATTPAVLEAIQQMWRKELGIEISLVQREARTHLAALQSGDYAIGLVAAIPDYDGVSSLCGELQSGRPGNYPHWSNAGYDQLAAGAGRNALAAERNAQYQRAEKILLDDMPLIPLYFNAHNFLVQNQVVNWRADALWTRFYEELSIRRN